MAKPQRVRFTVEAYGQEITLEADYEWEPPQKETCDCPGADGGWLIYDIYDANGAKLDHLNEYETKTACAAAEAALDGLTEAEEEADADARYDAWRETRYERTVHRD